ncbi:MAG: hypothetical protein R3C49_21085 [Planctomycetaceae bacterium]
MITGGLVYAFSNLPVILGVCLGYFAMRPGRQIPYGEDSLLLRFAAWDGGQFMTIMEHGYSFRADQVSNVALFPGYPTLALGLQQLTGISSVTALLVTAHLCLCAAFIVWHRYLTIRFPEQPATAFLGVAALALFPTSFYLRMAYSESLFVLLAATVLLGLHRRWPVTVVAFLVGAAVSVRLVGIAMIPALIVTVVTDKICVPQKVKKLIISLPLCCWGLGAYMLFLWHHLGEPLAFSKAQAMFCLRAPVSPVEHWYRLVTLEPIFSNYLSDSDAYWGRHDASLPALLSLQFANPIWFVLTLVTVIGGWIRNQISDSEFAFGLSLLCVSYAGRAEEFCMGCQARYAISVLPVYIVAGGILSRWPPTPILGTAMLSVSLLTAYSSMFASWHFFL